MQKAVFSRCRLCLHVIYGLLFSMFIPSLTSCIMFEHIHAISSLRTKEAFLNEKSLTSGYYVSPNGIYIETISGSNIEISLIQAWINGATSMEMTIKSTGERKLNIHPFECTLTPLHNIADTPRVLCNPGLENTSYFASDYYLFENGTSKKNANDENVILVNPGSTTDFKLVFPVDWYSSAKVIIPIYCDDQLNQDILKLELLIQGLGKPLTW